MTRLILDNLCSVIVDCAHKTAPLDEFGGYFAVGTPAMRGNVIDYSEARRISKSTFDDWTARLRPRVGDLLLAREAPVGPVVRIPPAENVAPGQRTVLLRPNPSVADSRFLYYYLISPERQRELLAKASGSTVPHLNVADVRIFPMSGVPHLSKQHAIADVLGAFDDKIAANKHAIASARELSDVRFRRALQSYPARRTTLGELVDHGVLGLGDGYRTKRSEHGTPGPRILRAADVRDFRIFPDGAEYVSNDYRTRIGAKVSRSGDIVLTTKGTVGRVAIVPARMEEVVYSPQTCYFRIFKEDVVDFGYLAAWFNSRDLADQLAIVMHKSDMAPYVNLQDIRSLRAPLPEISVQRDEGSFQRSAIESIHALSSENDALAGARDELLPLLLAGRIGVRDAEKVVEEVV
ncbi:restriction endonuclease subunit S [Phytohabitans flavus]|uniref:restriction endonuclease subunit S n=1 Tax=Phytohabitans flavus TaxID=1076124 RepID=UPI00363DC6C6